MSDGTGIFTIPPGTPFVDALAAGLVERLGDDALVLTGATFLLPTRRACRALADGFLRHGGGRPLLLPRMMPIGDLDELSVLLPSGLPGVQVPAGLPDEEFVNGIAQISDLAELAGHDGITQIGDFGGIANIGGL